MGDNFIFDVFETFIIDVVREQKPGTRLNSELLETIRSDCRRISESREETEMTGFAADVTNEYKDAVLEFYFENLVLTPDSVWLGVLPHASDIKFRAEEDQVVMELTYKDLFAA